MAQDKYLSWDVFFNDPVIRNIYDSSACLAWLVDDAPPSLPSPSETFSSMSKSAGIRPSENTFALMTQAGMLPVGPVPPISPSIQPPSPAAAKAVVTTAAEQIFNPTHNFFGDEVSSKVSIFSHIIDGIAVGYVYDPNTSIDSKLIHPDAHLDEMLEAVHSDAAVAGSIAGDTAVSKKFAAVLYNHEIMTMILAKFPGGSYLVITGCSDYASATYNMHYYVLTDMPRAVVLLSPPITPDELRALEPLLPLNRHLLTTNNDNRNDSDNNDTVDATATFFQPFLVNGKSKLRDQQTGSNIPSFFAPVLGKGYADTHDAHLVFHCYVGLETQCPMCALRRVQCLCPPFTKQPIPAWTALPEKIRRTYNPTVKDFMAKFEATHNGTYFTRVWGQIPQSSFQVEAFTDILTSLGRVQAYDFAKAAYINQHFRKIFKPRIMMGLSSTDLCDPDCRKRNDDDDDRIILRKDNIDEIMQNPVRFFVSLKISTSTEKRKASSYYRNPPMSSGLQHPFMDIDPMRIEDKSQPYFFASTTEPTNKPADASLSLLEEALDSTSFNDLWPDTEDIWLLPDDIKNENNINIDLNHNNNNNNNIINKSDLCDNNIIINGTDSVDNSYNNNINNSSDSTIKIIKTSPESSGSLGSSASPIDRIPCPQCSSTFKTTWHLREHIKVVHAGIKSHKCDSCDASFARKGDRNKHVRLVHEKVRKHICEDCGLMLAQKGDLLKHRRRKHIASG